MINKIKKSLYAVVLSVLAFSCADPDLNPIVTFDILGKGGYPRLVSLNSPLEIDLNDIPGSFFAYEVEFVTIDKGENVASYEVYVRLSSGDPDDNVLHASYTQGDFTTNGDGFRGITVNFPFADVASTLGVDPNTLQAGDYVIFDSYVVLDNGARFGQDNSTSAVNGSAFGGFFRNRLNITCPLQSTQYVGEYSVAFVDPDASSNCFTGTSPSFEIESNVTLSENSGASTRRNVSLNSNWSWNYSSPGFFYGGDGGILELVCDNIRMINSIDLNGQCGGIPIQIFNAAATPIPTDLNDDATFTLDLYEGGSCGCPDNAIQLTFTKI